MGDTEERSGQRHILRCQVSLREEAGSGVCLILKIYILRHEKIKNVGHFT